jgi:anti-anti-sigma factor
VVELRGMAHPHVAVRSDDGNGLKLVGELDVATAPQLTAALRGMPPTGEVVLDLSELTFIDSCGVHAILDLANTRNGDGSVVILDPSDPVAACSRSSNSTCTQAFSCDERSSETHGARS